MDAATDRAWSVDLLVAGRWGMVGFFLAPLPPVDSGEEGYRAALTNYLESTRLPDASYRLRVDSTVVELDFRRSTPLKPISPYRWARL